MGGVGILAANSMLGEITQQMANSISSSHARKIVIPFGKCNITVPGTTEYTLKELVTLSVEAVQKILEESHG